MNSILLIFSILFGFTNSVRLDEILESIPNYEMYELYDPIDESQEIIQDQQNTQKVYNNLQNLFDVLSDRDSIIMNG